MKYIAFLLLSFDGTIGRLEYFFGSCGLVVAIVGWYFAVDLFEPVIPFTAVFAATVVLLILVTWVHAALNIKRFSEFGARRYWWLCLIPYLNAAIFLFMSSVKTWHQVGRM